MTDLTVGKPWTVLWKFSLPMFVSVIFQQMYSIFDSIIAGKFAGEDALAAVGASYPITMISVHDSKKQIISGLILAVVVIVMALDLKSISLEMAAIIGALVCVLTGCLTEKQAYASIDWVTIFLFAGMMPVSTAMDKTGAGKLIAEWAVSLMGGSPTPIIMTSVLFIISCTLTQFMSNTAAAALLAPVGVAISQQLGASPKAVLMAIGVAASCAFATPVGTPPCTLVLGPGGYKFMDYVKVGVPLVILCFIVSIIVIPMVWPFFPG